MLPAQEAFFYLKGFCHHDQIQIRINRIMKCLMIYMECHNMSQNDEIGIYYYCIIEFFINANIFIERWLYEFQQK